MGLDAGDVGRPAALAVAQAHSPSAYAGRGTGGAEPQVEDLDGDEPQLQRTPEVSTPPVLGNTPPPCTPPHAGQGGARLLAHSGKMLDGDGEEEEEDMPDVEQPERKKRRVTKPKPKPPMIIDQDIRISEAEATAMLSDTSAIVEAFPTLAGSPGGDDAGRTNLPAAQGGGGGGSRGSSGSQGQGDGRGGGSGDDISGGTGDGSFDHRMGGGARRTAPLLVPERSRVALARQLSRVTGKKRCWLFGSPLATMRGGAAAALPEADGGLRSARLDPDKQYELAVAIHTFPPVLAGGATAGLMQAWTSILIDSSNIRSVRARKDRAVSSDDGMSEPEVSSSEGRGERPWMESAEGEAIEGDESDAMEHDGENSEKRAGAALDAAVPAVRRGRAAAVGGRNSAQGDMELELEAGEGANYGQLVSVADGDEHRVSPDHEPEVLRNAAASGGYDLGYASGDGEGFGPSELGAAANGYDIDADALDGAGGAGGGRQSMARRRSSFGAAYFDLELDDDVFARDDQGDEELPRLSLSGLELPLGTLGVGEVHSTRRDERDDGSEASSEVLSNSDGSVVAAAAAADGGAESGGASRRGSSERRRRRDSHRSLDASYATGTLKVAEMLGQLLPEENSRVGDFHAPNKAPLGSPYPPSLGPRSPPRTSLLLACVLMSRN